MVLVYITATTIILSTVSLIGAVLLSANKVVLNKIVFLLVGLSTGTLLGTTFFHLLPESLENMEPMQVFSIVLVSFSVFFLLEKFLYWHHCHDGLCDKHGLGYINLIGDSIHNFADGLIIAAAFMIDIRLGIISSLALAFHEIPQELGDFGILTYAGFERKRALLFNFLAAATSIVGGVLGYFFLSHIPTILQYLLPIAAGSFLYISSSDLIPELIKETNIKRSMASFALFIAGLILMYFLAGIE